jgi:hypothetical protein
MQEINGIHYRKGQPYFLIWQYSPKKEQENPNEILGKILTKEMSLVVGEDVVESRDGPYISLERNSDRKRLLEWRVPQPIPHVMRKERKTLIQGVWFQENGHEALFTLIRVSALNFDEFRVREMNGEPFKDGMLKAGIVMEFCPGASVQSIQDAAKRAGLRLLNG